MTNRNEELRTKVMKAQNVDEVADLLREAGTDEALAEQIWNEMSSHRESEELSLDELNAVSGGAFR